MSCNIPREVTMCKACSVCVLLLLILASAFVLATAGEKGGDGSEAMKFLVQRELRDQAILPRIENGVVVGDSPRAVKLMEYIAEDYKGRLGGAISSITYSVTAGIGQISDTALAVGQFRQGRGPIASYLLALGTDVETSRAAIVLISYQNKQGSWHARSMLNWNDTAKAWKVVYRSTPGPTTVPDTVAELK